MESTNSAAIHFNFVLYWTVANLLTRYRPPLLHIYIRLCMDLRNGWKISDIIYPCNCGIFTCTIQLLCALNAGKYCLGRIIFGIQMHPATGRKPYTEQRRKENYATYHLGKQPEMNTINHSKVDTPQVLGGLPALKRTNPT